jgi:cell filamentation protein
MPDRYTYPDSEILRNIPGLIDAARAREFEVLVAHVRILELRAHPVVAETFDLAHLQAIHRFVYQDIWEWAGELRTVDTGTVGTNLAHARPAYIAEQGRHIFRGLAADDHLRGMDVDAFADRLAYHWGEITALHPFRDGNTRAQRLFIAQLVEQAGHHLDWTALNERLPDLTHARLLAHAGDHHQLADLLRDHLERPGTKHDIRRQTAGVAIPLSLQLGRRPGVEPLASEIDDSGAADADRATTDDTELRPGPRQTRRSPRRR